MRDSTCTLFKKCATYLPTEERPYRYMEDTWICEMSKRDSKQFGVQFVDIIESSAIAGIVNATPGVTTMTVSEAILDADRPELFIPMGARVKFSDAPDLRPRRQLAAKTGTLRALVVRVTDRNNLSPDKSAAEIRDDVFHDAVSLKSQTDACSYGKLKIEPFVGATPNNYNVDDGVIEVSVDYDVTSDAPYFSETIMRTTSDLIGDLDDPMFGLIMFCFPPGNPDPFLSFAYPKSKYSFYNNE